MEDQDITLRRHTRGEWTSRQLKAAVLAVLLCCKREVLLGVRIIPFLSAVQITAETGGNHGSVKTLLKKWSTWTPGRPRCIVRINCKPFAYRITDRGEANFYLLINGYWNRRGRFIKVDKRELYRRCPGLAARSKAK